MRPEGGAADLVAGGNHGLARVRDWTTKTTAGQQWRGGSGGGPDNTDNRDCTADNGDNSRQTVLHPRQGGDSSPSRQQVWSATGSRCWAGWDGMKEPDVDTR